MTTKTINCSFTIFHLFSLLTTQPEQSLFDEEQQLAAELTAALQKKIEYQRLPDIDPDDFEDLYTWFLS